MKTKNIFRMLLMAVVLLMGANNAKADEIVLWDGSGSYSSEQTFTASGFSGINATQLRIYQDEASNIQVLTADKSEPYFTDNGQPYIYGGYQYFNSDHYELDITDDMLEKLQKKGLCVVSHYWKGGFLKISVIGTREEGGGPVFPTLSFSGDVTMNLGTEFTAPTLENPDGLALTWSSSNESVATVDESGNVTVLSVGTTTISAAFEGNESFKAKTISYTITVNKGTPVLSFPEAEYTATMGLEFTLPTLNNPNGVNVYYYSNNTGPCDVDRSTGAITLKQQGETTIIAKFDGDDNWYGAQAEYKIVITKRTPTLSFPEAEYTAIIGEKFTPPTLNNPENLSVSYYINNQWPAEVEAKTGAITLKNAGETEVYAKFDGDNIWNSVQTSYKLIVTQGTAPAKTDVALSFPQQAYTATMGETFTAPTLTNESGVSVTYSSSNTGVATVDASTGDVSLVGAGETTITASFAGDDSYNATSAQYTLTVSAAQEPVVVTNGETTIWQSTHDGNYWTIDASNFSNAVKTTKICVYVNNTTGIWMKGGDNGWTTLWSGGTGDGGEYNGTNYYNSTYGCYEFEIGSSSNLSLLQTSGLRIQSKGSTITKVTLLNGEHTGEPAPVPTTYTVSIANGIQNGSVSANPANAEEGATVTLTVSPNDGYRLESLTVTDANDQAVAVNNNQFTMPASNVTVSATFAQVQSAEFTFTINVTGEGSVNLNRETAKEGDEVTINAQPNQYYYELGELTVVDADNNQITVTDNKFTMPASNVTISAKFVAKKYTLTWTITGDETPLLVQKVAYGETIVNPKAPEREGYVFNGWEQHSETMPAYDLTINGSFSQIYNITLVYDETQGTVTIDKSQSLGNEELHLTITPNEGLQIASVTATDATGNLQVWNDYTTFRINASDVTVTVTFKKADAVVYNVTNNNDAQNGRVWADVNKAVAGQTVKLGNQPNQGYELDHYVVTAGEERIEVTNGQFTMPEGDVTISGVFKLGTYTITYYVDGQVVATQTYTYGDPIALPEEPTKEGYTFNGWQNLNYQTMPGWNLQVYATFTQNGGGGGGQDTEDDTQYVNVTVGTTGYATLCSDKALDVTGLSVYYAESIGDENVTLKKLTGVVAAGTGLIVKGNSSIPVSNEAGTSPTGNLLVGVTSDTEAPAGAYVLVSRNDGDPTFAQTSETSKATVPAGKAYLMARSGARFLNIVFDDNATGISTLKTKLTGEETIYNLRGQRVTNPTTGLYIVNGKKVFIK